jgi:hypothetical protein
MQVVKMGGPVYRIGVGGGSASSVEVRDPNMSDWFGDLNIFNQQYAVIIYGMFCYSPNLTLCNEHLSHPSKHITHNLHALCYLVTYNGCNSWSSISSGLSQVGVLGRLIIGTPVRLIAGEPYNRYSLHCFGLWLQWQTHLRACAKIADNFRRNYFVCVETWFC